ncbi:MAG: GcrA family cell cycle regulator [Minisyncoccia bacterium]
MKDLLWETELYLRALGKVLLEDLKTADMADRISVAVGAKISRDAIYKVMARVQTKKDLLKFFDEEQVEHMYLLRRRRKNQGKIGKHKSGEEVPRRYVSCLADTTRSVLALARHQCGWPIGHPSEYGFRFCGLTKEVGKNYCEEHQRIAYEANSAPGRYKKKKGAIEERCPDQFRRTPNF